LLRQCAERGLVFNIQRHCTEDGPGIRTTVFLKGCVMKCPWCQNPEGIKPYPEIVWYDVYCIKDGKCVKACTKGALELTDKGVEINRTKCDICGACVNACPAGALEVIGRYYTVNELVPELLKDKVFYDVSGGGVTLSGGEPAMQHAFSTALVQELKRVGIHSAIETGLGVKWENLRPLVEAVDLVIMDIKLMDERKHLECTGVDLNLVLTNAKKISEMGKPIWIRTPVIPRYTNYEDNIRAIARFIYEKLSNVERYELIAFNKACVKKYERFGIKWILADEELLTESRMEELVKVAKEEGLTAVCWSGIAKRK